jgi:voltage-gated potassium channel
LDHRPRQEPKVRILAPILILATVTLAGGLELYSLGHGRWSLAETMYMAVNAVSTVGFHEVEGMDHVRYARAVTAGIILAGLGAVAYFQSSLTALLVQGVIGERFRRKRMQSRIEGLHDHVIVTGAGSTGMHAIEELYATRTPFVAVDRSREVLERISTELVNGELLYIVGDATDDMVLAQAGITRAKG